MSHEIFSGTTFIPNCLQFLVLKKNKHTASPNPAIVNSADYSYADRADVIIIHETLHTP